MFQFAGRGVGASGFAEEQLPLLKQASRQITGMSLERVVKGAGYLVAEKVLAAEILNQVFGD